MKVCILVNEFGAQKVIAPTLRDACEGKNFTFAFDLKYLTTALNFMDEKARSYVESRYGH